ncbi:hypothetical protein, partial [Streptomyces telluris]|uniref:Uncharacterized protein n=1 Tax=Streptomyces telluris TaxID=2720021 RepID=A0A9X2LPM0_9ACTN
MPEMISVVPASAADPTKRYLLARLRRSTTALEVRISVHALACPVVPENGKVVISSGEWEVLKVPAAVVAGRLEDAEQRGVAVLTSCLRCGGWPSVSPGG